MNFVENFNLDSKVNPEFCNKNTALHFVFLFEFILTIFVPRCHANLNKNWIYMYKQIARKTPYLLKINSILFDLF